MNSIFWGQKLKSLTFVQFLFQGFAGTPGYLSPEVLKKEPYGRPVDLWACGKNIIFGYYITCI